MLPSQARNSTLALWAVILPAALVLRLARFVGWGLGDDAYFAWIANRLARGGPLDLDFGVGYRLGLHLPNALSFALFGTNDVAFVLYPLLCSLGTVLLAYCIGRRIAGPGVGLIGATLLAFSSFDVAFASTMTIDVVVAFLSALTVLLFLKAEEVSGRLASLLWSLSALTLGFAYMVKIPALALAGVLALYTATTPRGFVRHAPFYAVLTAVWAGLCLADYVHSGRFLNYWILERACAPKYVPGHLAQVLAYYPRVMFLPAVTFDTLVFGLSFHAAVPALAYALFARLRQCRLLVLWVSGLFLFFEFLPGRLGLPYEPLPRFLRYLDALIVPSLLLVAVALDALASRSRLAASGALVVLLASSTAAGGRIAAVYHDALRDERLAASFLESLPADAVFTDNRLFDRLNFQQAYSGRLHLVWMQTHIEQGRTPAWLAALGPGYVVTGGARGPEVSRHAVFELGSLRPPPLWLLLNTIEGAPQPWRREPLQIFYAPQP